MRNLSEDIAEMFAALGGGWEHHVDRVERFCHAMRRKHRDYHREYSGRRYRLEPDFRARHRAAVERYLDRKLGADRKRRHRGPIAIKHGTYHAYTKGGCRCLACRRASAAYQRERRARQAGNPIRIAEAT